MYTRCDRFRRARNSACLRQPRTNPSKLLSPVTNAGYRITESQAPQRSHRATFGQLSIPGVVLRHRDDSKILRIFASESLCEAPIERAAFSGAEVLDDVGAV